MDVQIQWWIIAFLIFTRFRGNYLMKKIKFNFQTFGSALLSLQQRTWLIHWSLFVFFNHPKGRDLIIDMFLYSQLYLNAIQTMCPHILRYLTTAVITNKTRRRTVLKDLVKVIQQVCIFVSNFKNILDVYILNNWYRTRLFMHC